MTVRCSSGHSVTVRPGEIWVCPTCMARTRSRLEAAARRARQRYERQIRLLRSRIRYP
jgi:hypothetical protein